MVCDKFTDCIQCIVKCKFWYVLLQNTCYYCLLDPTSSSAPVAELYNNTGNCPAPSSPVDSAGLSIYGTVIGLILGISIVGYGIWYWKQKINLSCLRRRGMGTRQRMRYYDLDREMDVIEMDPFPSPIRAELPTEDGRGIKPSVLERNDSISLQQIRNHETEF